MTSPQSEKLHPDDVGLPEQAIRTRRRSRRVARIMLSIFLATAIAGWTLFGSSIFSAMKIKDQPPSLVIIAYAFLIVSSVTLILGLWYLLIAQVERIARMVDADELDSPTIDSLRCHNCGWTIDAPDRFCRHCGKALTQEHPQAPPESPHVPPAPGHHPVPQP